MGCNSMVWDATGSLMETENLMIFRHVSIMLLPWSFHIFPFFGPWIRSRCNRIDQVSQLLFLGGCTALEQVAFQEKASDGNSICDDPMYRCLARKEYPKDTERYPEFVPILSNSHIFFRDLSHHRKLLGMQSCSAEIPFGVDPPELRHLRLQSVALAETAGWCSPGQGTG